MFTAYILRDENGKVYKGVTSNLEKRLADHRSGHTRTTRMMKNLRLVYKEEYNMVHLNRQGIGSCISNQPQGEDF